MADCEWSKAPRRWEVFRAADQTRAEGKERVSSRTVWARVKLNAGVAGTNQLVGEHLAAWTEERKYTLSRNGRNRLMYESRQKSLHLTCVAEHSLSEL